MRDVAGSLYQGGLHEVRNIIDRIAIIRDGLLMLRIVVHAPANSEPSFALVLLLSFMEGLPGARNS